MGEATHPDLTDSTYLTWLNWIYLIGTVFAVAAITAKFSPHYWVHMALITPTVVCLSASASGQLTRLGEQRALDTVVGAVLVLIAAGVTLGHAKLEEIRGHPPTVEVPAIAGTPIDPAPASPQAVQS